MASGQTLLLKGPRSCPLTGDENQPFKPKSRRPRAQVALTVSSAEATASAEEASPMATTTSAPTTTATCAPTLHQRMAAAPACTGRSPLKSSRTGRHRPPHGGIVSERGQDNPRTQTPPMRRTASWTIPRCARHNSHPCGGRTATPGSSGRRQRRRPRQSQLSQQARHAGADDACGRPVPRCRSSPPPQGR